MGTKSGTKSVSVQSNRCGAWAALTLVAILGGCARVDFDAGGWFQKPLDIFGHKGGYTYSELGEAKKQQRPIAANDLVDAAGACPLPAAQQAGPQATSPGAAPAATPDSLVDGGIALGMTECEVVARAGTPNSVQLGKNPNGERTAVLAYNAGPRAGIYHFEHGQLMQMDRVAEPPAPVAKKKPAKTSKQAARD